MHLTRRFLFAAPLAFSTACGGSSHDSNTPPPPQTGSVNLMLSDA